jgi:outer membrane murein-binding lipoprotein Lpp
MADDHAARIAREGAMIERARCLPSWPEMAAQLARLAQEMQTLKAHVDALEQECEALRARELIQLWEREA